MDDLQSHLYKQGRDSGFIAAVNYCLIPETAFTLDGLLRSLEERLKQRGHVVIVVAEGAGQELLADGWLWNSVITSTGQPRKIM